MFFNFFYFKEQKTALKNSYQTRYEPIFFTFEGQDSGITTYFKGFYLEKTIILNE